MLETENPQSGDISDLFRQRVLSGEQHGSIYFFDDLHNLEKEGLFSQSIRISAAELPKGRESDICNLLKAFIEKNRDRVSKQVVITGTQEQYERLIRSGCANALASGVQFEVLEAK